MRYKEGKIMKLGKRVSQKNRQFFVFWIHTEEKENQKRHSEEHACSDSFLGLFCRVDENGFKG